MDEEYSQRNFLRVIKRIPIIIQNFQCGVSVRVLSSQNQCSEEIIEEIIRLGFKTEFGKVNLNTIETPEFYEQPVL